MPAPNALSHSTVTQHSPKRFLTIAHLALVMAGVSAFYQKVVKGIVILLAGLGNTWRRRHNTT